ncbi:MAG TPA: hypothetical protein VEH49_07575, partial [Methylomirabilota bacterium]|nr:hypothetical protein [Methylomirabilota bacterium]
MSRPAQFAKEITAILLSSLFAVPLPAAAAGAGKSASSAASPRPPVKSARKRAPKVVDPAAGDVPDYDDPAIRSAAVDALGHYDGTVVAVDPNSGRILTIVNQKMAFSD